MTIDTFLRELAAMTLEGEDLDGQEFEWENDDAWACIQHAIVTARMLLKGEV